jgi:uncharacterized protein (DUF2147 family)
MRLFPLALLLSVVATSARAAPDVTGNWVTEEKTGLVSIRACGRSLCGTIGRVLVSRPGVPTTDVKNPDPALRSRPLLGLRILSGFAPAADGWENGRIYDPKSGKSYRSHLKVNPDGSLKVSGCIAFICKSQRWTRAR